MCIRDRALGGGGGTTREPGFSYTVTPIGSSPNAANFMHDNQERLGPFGEFGGLPGGVGNSSSASKGDVDATGVGCGGGGAAWYGGGSPFEAGNGFKGTVIVEF